MKRVWAQTLYPECSVTDYYLEEYVWDGAVILRISRGGRDGPAIAIMPADAVRLAYAILARYERPKER